MATRTILSVDDSPSIRQTVKLTLGAAGYCVMEAPSGARAIELCAEQRFELILTDLNMPDMDGITLIKQLRTMPAYKFVPIIMLTTESQATRKAAGKAAGATGWIVKPFTPQQLVALTQRLCPT